MISQKKKKGFGKKSIIALQMRPKILSDGNFTLRIHNRDYYIQTFTKEVLQLRWNEHLLKAYFQKGNDSIVTLMVSITSAVFL